MRQTSRLALLLAVVAALGTGVARGAEPALEGMYAAEGSNSDGSAYRGVVKIVRHGEGYLLAWMSGRIEGETLVLVPRSAGIGVASDEVLAVSYYAQDVSGVILYRIEDSGQRLVGRWLVAGADGTLHRETLTKLTMPAVPESESSRRLTREKAVRVIQAVAADRDRLGAP